MAAEKDAFKFCPNCGQQLETKKQASLAANPVVKFCPECGLLLGKDGRCKNPDCPLKGTIPPIS